MIKAETVFVVGAGASKEAGLPLGSELRSLVEKCLDWEFQDFGNLIRGDQEVVNAARLHDALGESQNLQFRNFEKYASAAKLIARGMPQVLSIDNFLDMHSGDRTIEFCGKLAVASTILNSEKESPLYADQRNIYSTPRFDQLNRTWFTKLLQAITTGYQRSNLWHAFENISFVTFNYDRCIEQFFFYSLKNLFDLSDAEAGRIVSTLEIYHPYGHVGFLPWQNKAPSVPFGASPKAADLLAISSQIKTFTEQVEDSDFMRAMRRRVSEAEQVVFLGFAFHDQNMRLLKPNQDTFAYRILATGKGISATDREIVHEDLKSMFESPDGEGPAIYIGADMTCVDLFDEYWRTLLAD